MVDFLFAITEHLSLAIETAGTWHKLAIELTEDTDRDITTVTGNIRKACFFSYRQRGNVVSFQHAVTTE